MEGIRAVETMLQDYSDGELLEATSRAARENNMDRLRAINEEVTVRLAQKEEGLRLLKLVKISIELRLPDLDQPQEGL